MYNAHLLVMFLLFKNKLKLKILINHFWQNFQHLKQSVKNSFESVLEKIKEPSFINKTIGNISPSLIEYKVTYDKQINTYNASPRIVDETTTQPVNFSCPKFKHILTHLLFMKHGYMFNDVLQSETDFIAQPHYNIKNVRDPIEVEEKGKKEQDEKEKEEE